MGRVIAEVEAFCELGGFRKFLIKSMFHGEPPKELRGDDIFPERRGSGPVYVGADLKEQVNSFGAVRLVRAVNVLGIHYVSLSKSSELIWRQAEGKLGRLSGRATVETLMNLRRVGINFRLKKAYFEEKRA